MGQLAAGLHLGGGGRIVAAGWLLLVDNQLALGHIRTQAFAIVVRADAGIGNGKDEENDSEHSEGGKFLACREIGCLETWRVHADELEDEIGEATKVEDLRIR